MCRSAYVIIALGVCYSPMTEEGLLDVMLRDEWSGWKLPMYTAVHDLWCGSADCVVQLM